MWLPVAKGAAASRNALALAEAAILIARSIRKNELLAQSYRVKANVLAASGDYQASVELYDAALTLFEKAKDQEGIARTLTAAIQPHIMLGAYDQAFGVARRAQRIFLELGDERRLARLENNIGNIYHRQDRFKEALAHYERAYRDLLPHGDSEELTISLNNMSMCLISMNNFAQALSTYERAKKLLQARNLPLIRLITDYNIAYLYYLRGDYRRAIEMLKSARIAGEKIGYTYLVALCYLDLSDIYVELNRSAEAQDAAEEGYLLFRKLEIGYEAAKTLANQAIAFGSCVRAPSQAATGICSGTRNTSRNAAHCLVYQPSRMATPPITSRLNVGHASSGVMPFFASSASCVFMPR